MLGGVLTQILVLFAVTCVGFFAAKLGIFNSQVNGSFNKLLLYICVPCTIVSSAVGDTSGYARETVYLALACSAGLCVVLPVLGWLLNVVMRVPRTERPLRQFMTMCTNFGFMGYPVAQAFYGESALFLHSLVIICLHTMMFVGASLLLGDGLAKKGWRSFVRELISPGLVASLTALALFFLQVELPSFLNGALDQIAGITSPLAMMLIGAGLVGLQPKEMLLDWRMHVYTVVKQLVVPLLVWFVLAPVFPDRMVLGLTVLVMALPIAAMTVVFAGQYGRDTSYVSRNIVLTTVWSFALLPLLGMVIVG